MTEVDDLKGHSGIAGKGFQTTAWSDIQRATQEEDSALALEAWEHLCRAYWMPVYYHICRWGNSPEAAKDLTQDFFYHLLCRERLKKADRARGKFRSFLLTTLNHFLHSEWDTPPSLQEMARHHYASLAHRPAPLPSLSEPHARHCRD